SRSRRGCPRRCDTTRPPRAPTWSRCRRSRVRRHAERRAPIALMNFSLAICDEREYQLHLLRSLLFKRCDEVKGGWTRPSRAAGGGGGAVWCLGGGRSRVNARVGELGDFSPACGALRGGSSEARRGSGSKWG